jgi:prepilin-type N-terminal cleavage/methylation domain-containing protein
MRKREQGFTLIEIMVVIAIIAGLVTAVSVVVPLAQERAARGEAMRHLSQLGVLYQQEKMDKGGRPRFDGAALWLSYRVLPAGGIKEKQEDLLFDPRDPTALRPRSDEERKAYNDIDLKDPEQWKDKTSFAARDFSTYPLGAGAGRDLQIIGCLRQGSDGRTPHYEEGLIVLYEDGSVKFEDLESLGMSRGQEIVVGPDSSHEALSKVVYAKSRKD